MSDLLPPPTAPFTYLGGPAGSGKTFLVRSWADAARGYLLTASTGIAAINLGGAVTINAALGYFNAESLKEKFTLGQLTGTLGKLWRTGITRIVIDEASMLSGDVVTYLVRAIDEVNGKGYVLDSRWEDEATPPALGLTLVGDFLQLGPVPEKDPHPTGRKKNLPVVHAFESEEWHQFESTVLTSMYRQADPDFIHALRAARLGKGSQALEFFRSRLVAQSDDRFEGSTLFAKNDAVERHNQLRLDKLPGRSVVFESVRWGEQRTEWGKPDKPKQTWGVPEKLDLKEGALVMILANQYDETGSLLYANGDLGELLGADPESAAARVKLRRNDREVQVSYVQREVTIPADAERRKQLKDAGFPHLVKEKWEITGQITYMPLRLAYASTTHKSQGLTLDAVQIDLRDPFFKLPQMAYVALSRCRTAEGLRIVGSPAVFLDRCRVDQKVMRWA